MSKPKDIRAYYDNYGKIYDVERVSAYHRLLRKAEIAALLPHVKGKRVLEIGCGTGLVLEEISKHAAEARGIDASEGMLEQARRKGLNVRCNNATSIDYPDNSFDVIYSFKVLAHIPQIDNVLSEISRLLRPQGECVLEFYNPYSIKYFTNMLMGSRKKVYTRYDSPKSIRRLMNNKFQINDVVGVRIIIPCAGMIRGKRTEKIFEWIENKLRATPLKYFAGYLVYKGSVKKLQENGC